MGWPLFFRFPVAKILLPILLMLAEVTPLAAQLSNATCKTLPPRQSIFYLDSLSVYPQNIQVAGGLPFEYDITTGLLQFESDLPDSVEVCYQVYPFTLHQPVYLYDLSLYHPNGLPASADSANARRTFAPLAREEVFSTPALSKTGSISRGVTFGNTNNLGVISSLNLQLDGQLTEDLRINAVITDQQVPFQPEGNTQQLQDFDRVLLNIYNDQFSLQAGDVVLKNDSTYFLRYYKNVQGGSAAYHYNLGKGWKASTTIAASQAKGKFASVVLDAVEGLLGSYRLRGPEGERFIIVMANSERVFLDGRQLKRGFNEDYVIDYNLAEVTFNPRVLITKFSRLRVDFEYAVQNFSRSIVSASHRQTNGRTTAYMEMYREKDNPFRPLTYALSEADKQALAGIGDDLSQAVIDGAEQVGFSENRILYSQTDTLAPDGNTYTIYKYSTDPQTAVYKVTFTQVGAGNYRQLPLGLNGKVYEWVAPVDGVPQGDYEPFVQIVTPNSRQLAVGGVSTRLNSFETLFSEVAASQQDQNLFSGLDSEDDGGWSQRTGLKSEGRAVGFLKDYAWTSLASYEYNHRFFRPIDRFRYIEYDRDWSYQPTASTAAEAPSADNIAVGSLGMVKDNANRWNYQASYRKRGAAIDGWQQKALLRQQVGKVSISGDYFNLLSTQAADQSSWVRTDLTGAWEVGKVVPGYTFRTDRNAVSRLANDSVVASAMNFSEHLLFIQSAPALADSSATTFRLDASRRLDDRPAEGVLVRSDESYTSNASFATRWKESHSLAGTVTYRWLDNMLDNSDDKEETVQGRLDWQSAWWERAVRSDFSLALLNGRELRREYVFIAVMAGQGTHTWRDDNEDGVQDLNEFYEAVNPDERNYAKIFVPTDEYIRAYQTIFTYSVELGTPASWRSHNGVRGFLSKISNISSVSVDSKTQEAAWAGRLSVWEAPNSDDDLAYRNSIRSRWFFNRASPGYGMDVGYQSTDGRQLLTGGWEARSRRSWQLNTRNNFTADWAVFLQGELSESASSSDIFANRNYTIKHRQLRPQVQWMPLQWLRVTGSLRYSGKRALPAEAQGRSEATEYQVEWQANKTLQSTLSGCVKVISLAFEGDETSPLGYELLEALRPGTNYTWRLQWQQRLKNGLRLQLNYDGRKSPEKAVVHFGGVQVTALF